VPLLAHASIIRRAHALKNGLQETPKTYRPSIVPGPFFEKNRIFLSKIDFLTPKLIFPGKMMFYKIVPHKISRWNDPLMKVFECHENHLRGLPPPRGIFLCKKVNLSCN
jgi:hypothetical protein